VRVVHLLGSDLCDNFYLVASRAASGHGASSLSRVQHIAAIKLFPATTGHSMQATTLAAVMRASDIHPAQGWAQGCARRQKAMSSTEYQTASSFILKMDLADTLISSRFLRLPLLASLSSEQHEWP